MQRMIKSHNFRTGESVTVKRSISATYQHEVLREQCPWKVASIKARYPAAMCTLIALLILLVIYPYERLDYCNRDPRHPSCMEDRPGSGQPHMWLLLFPPLFLAYMALPAAGFLELAASIAAVCLPVFGIVWFLAQRVLRFSGHYKYELAARHQDHTNGDNLPQYLFTIVTELAKIPELVKVNVDNVGIHVIPPYPILPEHVKQQLWYFDHIVQDYKE